MSVQTLKGSESVYISEHPEHGSVPLKQSFWQMYLISNSNLLTMMDIFVRPHCSILSINATSNCNVSCNNSRVLDSSTNFPNLTLVEGNSAASLVVRLDGIEDDAMDAVMPIESSSEGICSIITSVGGVIPGLVGVTVAGLAVDV